MKKLLFVMMAFAFAVPAEAADVGVSITIGEPGFYGRIDIGDVPRPELIYPKPVVVVRPPRGTVREPVYLHVPPGHEKKWKKHCKKYNACGRPVYFVHDRWYNDVYVPEYRSRHGRRDGDRGDYRGGKGHGRGDGGRHDRN